MFHILAMSKTLPFHRQDAVERRWDGPVPPADPAAGPPPAGRARLFERLCGETALAAAARRAAVPAVLAALDDRLAGYGRLLGFYRHQASAWRGVGDSSSPGEAGGGDLTRRVDTAHR
ncbi:MAG: hypothetical protein HYU60_02200 [Magnetospirillum sp.]|nr:hypothetical protein [Magnetospirillum sp.]